MDGCSVLPLGLVLMTGIVGWPSAGHHIHGQGAAHRAAGVLAVGQRQRVARARLRKTMLALEIALTVTLLVSAGLLFKSFYAPADWRTWAAGIDHVHHDEIRPAQNPIRYARQGDAFPRVTAGGGAPAPRSARRGARIQRAWNRATGRRVCFFLRKPAPVTAFSTMAMTLTADPQYFSVMQIPLLRGRVFTEHERLGNSHYIVVSKQFADQFFR